MHTTAPRPATLPLERLPLPAGTYLRLLADGTVIGRYLRMDLASVFQPVMDSHGTLVGHEAFVRSHGRGDLSLTPWGLFSLADGGRALITLDRLCRLVHTLNFLRGPGDGLLFMNVHDRLLEAVADHHGQAFREMLRLLAFPPRQVVIEIPHTANDNRRLLALAAANFRNNGFAVALNVQQPAALPALLRVVQADYAKIDARSIADPESLRPLLDSARAGGTQLVCTRVGTPEQRVALGTLPGLLLQGNAIAPPRAQAVARTSICL